MKNLFTKLVFLALMCSTSHLMLAQCPTLDDVVFPPELLLSVDDIPFSEVYEAMTPEELVDTYGYTEADAYTTWDDPDVCGNLQLTFEDQAFDLGGGSFKILRNWTVLDWNNGNNVTEYQIIRNIVDLGSYCLNEVTISVNPWGCSTAFAASSFLASGFDYENLTSDPPEGTELGIGSTEVTINGSVAGEDFECTTIVNVVDATPPVAIAVQNITVTLLSPSCEAVLYPDQIDNGSHDGACGDVVLEISPSIITQADAGGEVIVNLIVTDEVGNFNITWTTVTVEDCGTSNSLTCVGITTVPSLDNAGIQLYPEDFLAGSTTFDNLSLTIEDEAGNIIPNNFIPQGSTGSFTYIVTDNDTGNSCWGTLNISSPIDPCATLACLSTVNTELSENGEVILSPSDLAIGVTDCPDLIINISDTDGNLLFMGPEVVLTEEGTYLYSVNNTNDNSCWGTLIIGEFVPCPSSLVCNNGVNVSMYSENGEPAIAIVNSDMLLEGNTSGCNIDNYNIDLQDTGIVGYQFAGIGSVVVDQAGVYNYTITNPDSGDSCWGTVYIQELGVCPGVSAVSFPDNIDIALTELTDDNLYDFISPESLQGALGFPENQTVPTWASTPGCNNLVNTYNDNIIVIGNGSYKIIRTWTVLDWLTEEIATGVQIIHNIVFPGLICDFLPNSAPLGDCASGHTDSDDVEWPDDLLNIEDYRIKPFELETYSGIEEADTKPIFVNNEDQYDLDYVDILNELQFNQITVFRVWSVTTGGTIVATYSQTLVIDISNFANLVSVNTMFDRPIPDVELNDNITTNILGVGYVDSDSEVSLTRVDQPTNGLTIKDLIYIQQYIVGFRDLNNLQILAADSDQDGTVSAIDIIQYKKTLLEVVPGYNPEWFFIDYTDSIESSILPKGNFVGVKPGDIDDDAYLGVASTFEAGIMVLRDVLINNGESYETTLEYKGEDLSLGVEVHLYYDADLIQVDELYVENEDMLLDYWIEIPGEIHLTLTNGVTPTGFLFADENLINIKFSATSNGLLSQAIDTDPTRNSYLLGLNYELVVLNVEFGTEIDTGTENTSEHTDLFKVYPSPATDLVYFDFLDRVPAEFTIQLFDTSGKLVIEKDNQTQVNVSSLNSGIYIYRLIQGEQAYSGHLSVIK